MYGLVAWCPDLPDLIVRGTRGFSRGSAPRARPHVPHIHSHVGGRSSSASSMGDAEAIVLCIFFGLLILILVLYAIERARASDDDIATPEQLRRARMIIEKRRG